MDLLPMVGQPVADIKSLWVSPNSPLVCSRKDSLGFLATCSQHSVLSFVARR